MTRRQAIKTSAIAVAALAATPHLISQGHSDLETKALVAGGVPFVLVPLPFAFDSLEPHLDARTMEIHHGYDFLTEQANEPSRVQSTDLLRRLQGKPSLPKIYHDGVHALYVKNLNSTFARHVSGLYYRWSGESQLGGEKLETASEKWLIEKLRDLNSVPELMRSDIRNNGGGHYNHSLFWQMMKKDGGGEPKVELAKAIETTFGNFANFKTKFSEAATKIFGNGWAWLTLDGKELKIETTPNEDTPLSAGRQPLLGLDVWEHAYYLKYQNKRADYIAAWWNVVNWDRVAERYTKLRG